MSEELDDLLDQADKAGESIVSDSAKKSAFAENKLKQYLGMLSLMPIWAKVMIGFLIVTIIIGFVTEIYLLYQYTSWGQWVIFITTLILIKIYNRYRIIIKSTILNILKRLRYSILRRLAKLEDKIENIRQKIHFKFKKKKS